MPSNLPPGVRDSDIPGNRDVDIEPGGVWGIVPPGGTEPLIATFALSDFAAFLRLLKTEMGWVNHDPDPREWIKNRKREGYTARRFRVVEVDNA